jgi:hypothetical protein
MALLAASPEPSGGHVHYDVLHHHDGVVDNPPDASRQSSHRIMLKLMLKNFMKTTADTRNRNDHRRYDGCAPTLRKNQPTSTDTQADQMLSATPDRFPHQDGLHKK